MWAKNPLKFTSTMKTATNFFELILISNYKNWQSCKNTWTLKLLRERRDHQPKEPTRNMFDTQLKKILLNSEPQPLWWRAFPQTLDSRRFSEPLHAFVCNTEWCTVMWVPKGRTNHNNRRCSILPTQHAFNIHTIKAFLCGSLNQRYRQTQEKLYWGKSQFDNPSRQQQIQRNR